MTWRWSVALVATASLASAAVAVPAHAAEADRGSGNGFSHVVTLDPSTHGNPEGVAWDPESKTFFVGTVGDGTIYRGTPDAATATVFIAGPKSAAVGMKVADGKLYVAGGPSGEVRVYDTVSGALSGSFPTGTGGFLNDLVVTDDGDVFVTDSFRPTLWHITAEQVDAGRGTPEAIDVSGGIAYQPGFNLNGIVALDDESLIVVQSNTGKLFRIDLEGDDHHGGRPKISTIDVEPLLGGDGLLLDRGRLIVVQGTPAMLTFVKLRHHTSSGTVVERRTDPNLRGPSTIARAGHVYLVVNADFGTSRTPFTVAVLPR
jgi:sugar lactone lactonase YvrE